MLKHLEISGFKSFAKKSTLDFTSSVTGIVGPNGSGKSNVVEAIRFVLGEQSMKSLRGKMGSDLIFKGSKVLPKLSRANVAIIFDNSKRDFKIDFDEVILSREVFTDGANKYLLNGSEVRLKDIHEALSGVNIGSSGHHIISQGEADRILSSSARDRRGMVEDALGLKIYQFRLKESEKKLEKTRANIKEVGLLRREIAPHILFLKKQVEKIEKADGMRHELLSLYQEYLKREETFLQIEKHNLISEEKNIIEKLDILDQTLSQSESQNISAKPVEENEKNITQNKLSDIRNLIDDLSRKIGRLEGMIEMKEQSINKPESQVQNKTERIVINREEIQKIISEIQQSIFEAQKVASLQDIFPLLKKIHELSNKIIPVETANFTNINKDHEIKDLEDLKNTRDQIVIEMNKLRDQEEIEKNKIKQIEILIEAKSVQSREADKNRFELMMQKNELTNTKNLLNIRREYIEKTEQQFLDELREASVLVGPQVLTYKGFTLESQDSGRNFQEDRHKKIERIKIKLEDAGASGGSEVLKEYEEVNERDTFLSKEVQDLNASMTSLESLIRELKETLDTQFRIGIEKINTQFQNFFSLVFGGGTAFLSLVAETKRKKKQDEDDEELSDIEEQEEQFEHGIDINVTLPQKKVKELSMLSGGERSLTSIALLFAISQVNPPPFLVLDETDAALDEANSRKYGDMIEKLSHFSQLVVVTHNRETMSRAQVLYGVTVGSDGGSKLLSLKFDEAVAVAK